MSRLTRAEARARSLDRWAYDPQTPAEATAAGRRGFLASFERKVDPDGLLDPDDRRRRAELALKAHMIRLAQRSAEARRR